MAKRTAENQMTKDDDDDDRFSDVEEGVREQPLKPVAGRVIRGLPKRAGGPAPAAPAPGAAAPAAPAPLPTFGASASQSATSSEAPKPAAFGGFSFGAPAASATPVPAFTFGASSNPPPAAAPPASTSQPAKPFSTFSFGQTAAQGPAAETGKPVSNPFSFGTSASEPPSTSATPTAFTFGSKPSAPAEPKDPEVQAAPRPFAGFSFSAKPAEPAPAPSSAPKDFSFSVSDSKKPNGSVASAAGSTADIQPSQRISAPPPAPESAPEPQPSQPTPPPEEQVSYYLALRGLNSSILSFLTRTIEKDPLVDLSQHLSSLAQQYEDKLDETARKAGWRSEGSKITSTGQKAVPLPSAKTDTPAAPPSSTAPAAVPEAPKVGSFSLLKPAATAAASVGGGFTPSLPTGGSSTTSSPFSFKFGTKAPEASVTSKKPSEEVSQLVNDVINETSNHENPKENVPKPFTFGATTAASAPPATERKSLFAFAPSGPLQPPTPDSKTFTPSADLESPSTPAKLGKFGPGGAQPQLAFGGAKAATPTLNPSTSKSSSGFSFGFGSAPASGSSAPSSGFSFGSTPTSSSEQKKDETAPAAKSTFSFGAPASAGSTSAASADKSASTGFSFGSKPSTGFSFGSSSNSNAAPSFSFGTSTSSSTPAAPAAGFSFKPSLPGSGESSQPLSRATSGGAEGGEDGGGAAEATEPVEPSKNLAESVGAGEEDEDTVTEFRAKLFKMDGGEPSAIGLGQLKLKRSKQPVDGKTKRRLLMRTDGGGNVVLNMGLTPTFAPRAENKHIRFVGVDMAGKPSVMTLMVKTADAAKQAAETMLHEVEALKKEGS